MNRRNMIASFLSLPIISRFVSTPEVKAESVPVYGMSNNSRLLFEHLQAMRNAGRYPAGSDRIYWSFQPCFHSDIKSNCYKTGVDIHWYDNEEFHNLPPVSPNKESFWWEGHVKAVEVYRGIYEYFNKFIPNKNPVDRHRLRLYAQDILEIDYIQMMIDQSNVKL